MKNIDNEMDYQEIQNRIALLSNANVRLWGRMNVSQMLVHCTRQLQLALGEIKSNPQGPVIMRTAFGKWFAFSIIPWPKGTSTPNEMNVEKNKFQSRDVEEGKSELLRYLYEVNNKQTLEDHPFFGTLSRKEWGRLIYKHLDHHLKQFNQ